MNHESAGGGPMVK